MDLHWRPVGPLPAKVYWRRRAVLLTAVLVLLLVLSTCAGGDPSERLAQERPAAGGDSAAGGDPTAGSTTTGPVPLSATPVPSGTPPTPDAPACEDTLLTVQSDAAPARVRKGRSADLRLAVTNNGAEPCTRPLGQGAVTLTVFSGADRIWSSDDCDPGGPADPVVLQPRERRLISVRWPGRRSRPGCAEPSGVAEPGSYRVVARVGSLAQEGRLFQVVP